jgi:Ca2+-binding RTX toxin-like protein
MTVKIAGATVNNATANIEDMIGGAKTVPLMKDVSGRFVDYLGWKTDARADFLTTSIELTDHDGIFSGNNYFELDAAGRSLTSLGVMAASLEDSSSGILGGDVLKGTNALQISVLASDTNRIWSFSLYNRFFASDATPGPGLEELDDGPRTDNYKVNFGDLANGTTPIGENISEKALWSGMNWNTSEFIDAAKAYRSGNTVPLFKLLDSQSYEFVGRDQYLYKPYYDDKGTIIRVNDVFHGYAQDDSIAGNVGDDTLHGGGGNDWINGNADNDQIFGDDGDDDLTGGNGVDFASGGNNNDTFFEYTKDGSDTYDGGDGIDTINFSKSTVRQFIDTRPTNEKEWYFGTNSSWKSIENFIGSFNDDVILLSNTDNVDNVIDGHFGDDLLGGGSGADKLLGYYGNDRLFGGAGKDRLYGGNDDDKAYGGADSDLIVGGKGDDYLLGQGSEDKILGGADEDTIYGGSSGDLLYGEKGEDYIFGGIGNDRVEGGDGIDRVYGEDGEDRVYGGNDRDFLYGGEGYDQLFGGDGNDYMVGGTQNDELTGGEGADRLFGQDGDQDIAGFFDAQSAVTVRLDLGTGTAGEAKGDTYSGIEGVYGSQFGDIIVGSGINNYLAGFAGADLLQGLGGQDTLRGGDGVDFLDGGADADILNGGEDFDYAVYLTAKAGVTVNLATPSANTGDAAGDTFLSIEGIGGSNFNDVLVGDSGGNIIGGGLGQDTPTGGASTNVDAITDFVAADDIFWLQKTGVFTTMTVGALPADAFQVASVASSAATRIVYNAENGKIFFDQDGAGGAAQVLFATIKPNAALTAADFLVT